MTFDQEKAPSATSLKTHRWMMVPNGPQGPIHDVRSFLFILPMPLWRRHSAGLRHLDILRHFGRDFWRKTPLFSTNKHRDFDGISSGVVISKLVDRFITTQTRPTGPTGGYNLIEALVRWSYKPTYHSGASPCKTMWDSQRLAAIQTWIKTYSTPHHPI